VCSSLGNVLNKADLARDVAISPSTASCASRNLVFRQSRESLEKESLELIGPYQVNDLLVRQDGVADKQPLHMKATRRSVAAWTENKRQPLPLAPDEIVG
jgi:hypothetical protein